MKWWKAIYEYAKKQGLRHESRTCKMAGFCFGVNRAVDTVYQEAVEHSPVYTYGPIIHNEEVIADLKRKGVQVIHSLEEAKEQAEGTVIIRSHGVTKAEQETLVADGLRVIDATCPFVKKIHRLVQEYSDKGYLVIIIGSVDHPEVQGIVGWSHADRTVVINCESDVEKLDLNAWKKVCIVAQTTFNYNKFQELVEIIQKKGYYSVSTVDKDSEIISIIIPYVVPQKNVREAAKEPSAESGCHVGASVG